MAVWIEGRRGTVEYALTISGGQAGVNTTMVVIVRE